ncbi:hypothetical protein D3C85_1689790 [compost metagenome]
MYRDYKKHPISNEAVIGEPDVEMFDEKTNLRNVFSAMEDVEGLSYTILVPLQ